MSQEPLERAEKAIEDARDAAQQVRMPFDGDDDGDVASEPDAGQNKPPADQPEQNEEDDEQAEQAERAQSRHQDNEQDDQAEPQQESRLQDDEQDDDDGSAQDT